MKKRKVFMYKSVPLLAVIMLLCACGGAKSSDTPYGTDGAKTFDDDSKEKVSETTGGVDSYAASADTDEIDECLGLLISGTDENHTDAVISEEITVVTYFTEGGLVTIDFDSSIYDVDSYKRILTLAGITRRLCELESVNNVSFTCEGFPLMDSKGNAYGAFNADSFVENEGALINAYERAELHLYFADEDGQRLVETTETLVYSSNISKERLVVDKVISGPLSSGVYPTVNPATEVNVVTTQDGVCYVDLGSQFLNKTTNVSDEVMIYSIVNSLTALNGINKVQILIDGGSDDPLVADIYERKLELVE